MTSYQITDIKHFMNCLLNQSSFDPFLLEEAVIITGYTYRIDGRRVDSFYTREELEDPNMARTVFTPWSDHKSLCLHMIKGKRTPVLMKLTMHTDPDLTVKTLKDGSCEEAASYIKSFAVNIRYENGTLSCVTGVSYSSFYLDKTPDSLWDKAFAAYLTMQGISFQ